MPSTFKTLILVLLITFSFLAVSKVANAGDIINAEFKCMPYQGGHIRGYSNLTENPFRIIEPDEIIVVVKGTDVRVKHMSFWETLRRDHSAASWVAASSDDLFMKHVHIRLTQDSATFKWQLT